jgi:hypothetical protein
MDPLFVLAPPMLMSMFEDLWQNAGIRDGMQPENGWNLSISRLKLSRRKTFFIFNVDRTT